MFSLNPMKELYESPLPPMALTDYEAFSKFLNQALHCCHETGRDFNVYLDWAIRALASSMAADSAARIFLPKTRTAPFSLDDLIPLSEIPSKGTVRVDLTKSYVVAPIWNNTDLVDAVKAFSDSGFENAQIDQVFGGAYIQELKLAIIDSPSDVDVPYILSQWDRNRIAGPGAPYGDPLQLRCQEVLQRLIEQKAGGCLLSVLFYRVVHPSDVIPFISEYLNAVPAIFSSGIHTSGKAHANLGQPIIENVLQMSAGCRPVIHNHFRQSYAQLRQPAVRDPVNVLCGIGTVADG